MVETLAKLGFQAENREAFDESPLPALRIRIRTDNIVLVEQHCTDLVEGICALYGLSHCESVHQMIRLEPAVPKLTASNSPTNTKSHSWSKHWPAMHLIAREYLFTAVFRSPEVLPPVSHRDLMLSVAGQIEVRDKGQETLKVTAVSIR